MGHSLFLDGKAGIKDEGAIGFYSWNVQENKVHGDEVIAHAFGLTPDALALGAPIEVVIQYVADGDRQRLAMAIHEGILTGLPFHADYTICHPNGLVVYVCANGRCLRDGEGIPSIYSGTIRISYDATKDIEGQDDLEIHCRAALGIATARRHSLAARYLSSALNVLGRNKNFGNS